VAGVSCRRAAALLVVMAGLVLVPHPAAAATLAKRCAEVTSSNTTVCAVYAWRDDRHRARARLDGADGAEGAVVVESVELERYSCLTRTWQVVRRTEGALATRAYADDTVMVKWRARVHWASRSGRASGTVTTPVHGFC
jgi:hypothetical protein